MKRHEKELLNVLSGANNIGDEEPLKNVKKALGSLSSVVGNPMFKAEITLQITTQIRDGAFNIVAPAALPVNLQTNLAAFIFGLTDYLGGYPNAPRLVDTFPWVLTTGQIANFNVGVVPGVSVPGDMIFQFIEPTGTFTAFVIIHCNNVAYGTFLNSFVSDLITVNLVRVVVPIPNINQLINPLIFGYQTLFGKLATDTVDPRMFKKPNDFQDQIADIPVTFPVDKNLLVGFEIDIFCQFITIVLYVQKVEPLTLRK